jgi:hypothetical protein
MRDLQRIAGSAYGHAAAEPAREDFTDFRDLLTLMTNQPGWDSV